MILIVAIVYLAYHFMIYIPIAALSKKIYHIEKPVVKEPYEALMEQMKEAAKLKQIKEAAVAKLNLPEPIIIENRSEILDL